MSELEETVNSENKKVPWKDSVKNYIVDTSIGLIVYTPLIATSEFLSGMDSEEIIKSRIVGNCINVFTTRPYTLLREKWAKYWNADASSSRVKKLLVDTSIQVMFQAPLYSISLYISGASLEEYAIAMPSALTLGAMSGRPFGYILDKWRKLWGTKPVLDK